MSASLPVKCHLPLITTRIEFEFNVLSPHPQITIRRDLGAIIRRQTRRATPYSRLTNSKATPISARRAESPLTEITETEDSDNEESWEHSCKIAKPKGEAGRSGSGGYNLQEAMGWENKEFATFTVSQITHILKSRI